MSDPILSEADRLDAELAAMTARGGRPRTAFSPPQAGASGYERILAARAALRARVERDTASELHALAASELFASASASASVRRRPSPPNGGARRRWLAVAACGALATPACAVLAGLAWFGSSHPPPRSAAVEPGASAGAFASAGPAPGAPRLGAFPASGAGSAGGSPLARPFEGGPAVEPGDDAPDVEAFAEWTGEGDTVSAAPDIDAPPFGEASAGAVERGGSRPGGDAVSAQAPAGAAGGIFVPRDGVLDARPLAGSAAGAGSVAAGDDTTLDNGVADAGSATWWAVDIEAGSVGSGSRPNSPAAAGSMADAGAVAELAEAPQAAADAGWIVAARDEAPPNAPTAHAELAADASAAAGREDGAPSGSNAEAGPVAGRETAGQPAATRDEARANDLVPDAGRAADNTSVAAAGRSAAPSVNAGSPIGEEEASPNASTADAGLAVASTADAGAAVAWVEAPPDSSDFDTNATARSGAVVAREGASPNGLAAGAEAGAGPAADAQATPPRAEAEPVTLASADDGITADEVKAALRSADEDRKDGPAPAERHSALAALPAPPNSAPDNASAEAPVGPVAALDGAASGSEPVGPAAETGGGAAEAAGTGPDSEPPGDSAAPVGPVAAVDGRAAGAGPVAAPSVTLPPAAAEPPPGAPGRAPPKARNGGAQIHAARAGDADAPKDAARCRAIVMRAQLGEETNHADRNYLRTACGGGRH